MRHVRVLGVLLAAMFAMSATTFVVASPALASCNQECKELKEKEKQEQKEAKEQEKLAEKQKKEQEKLEKKQKKEQEKLEKTNPGGEFTRMADCPFHYPSTGPGFGETQACIYGEAGPESFFQAGKVTVHFTKPIILRGGFQENEENGEIHFIGALNGETVSKEAEPAPSLTEGVNAELLPQFEKERFEKFVAKGGKATEVTAVIELAKPATDIGLNEANLLQETGTAFSFPVQIHLVNKFLGPFCYVGSIVHPIVVPFTTGETSPEPPNTPIHGHLGGISVIGGGQMLKVGNAERPTILANNEYASPGAEGCGLNGRADAAINSALGLPSPAGMNSTELIGELFQSGSEAAEEHMH